MSTPSTPQARAVVAELRRAHHVLIASHVDPDGDAIGSSLGLALALDRLGIKNDVVLSSSDEPPRTYAWLPQFDRYTTTEDLMRAHARFDLAAVLDSADASRLGDVAGLVHAAGQVIVVDHHPAEDAGRALSLVDTSAAATGILLWELLPFLGVKADSRIATCLYTALLTDTGRFSYSNTDARALRAAAEMVEAGADPNAIYVATYESRSLAAQALLARTLARLTVTNSGCVAYSWITALDFTETGATRAEAENLIDVVRPLEGIAVAFLAKCSDGEVRVSLRAKGDFDVRAVAAQFGGGGHRAAAGFTYEGELVALLAALLPLLPGGQQ